MERKSLYRLVGNFNLQLGLDFDSAAHFAFLNSSKILQTTMHSSCLQDIARHTSCSTTTFRYKTYASLQFTVNFIYFEISSLTSFFSFDI